MADAAAVVLILVLAVPLFGFLAVGLVLLIRDTVRRKGNWGINLIPAPCRKCGEPAPLVRRPTSWRQALWGGWTCAECGFELDKWGEPVPGQTTTAKWAALEALADLEDRDASRRRAARSARPGQFQARKGKRPADRRDDREGIQE